MAVTHAITSDKLIRLIGTPHCPLIVDVRADAAFDSDPVLVPGAIRRPAEDVAGWADEVQGPAIICCRVGGERSQGVAAWLRAHGRPAEALEGGISGWLEAGYPVVPAASLPPRDAAGTTLWVTRARPKVDRIACPWLIRRFVDRRATFLFVPPAEVAGVAGLLNATPFDVEGVHWSHRGDLCTFDTMVEEFGLAGLPGLARLSEIVRGADTARPDLAPQAAGLLAISLGLSRVYSDDHEQLAAGMLLYDAFYRWSRDAFEETHDWVSHTPRRRVRETQS